jgi:hypothetical protein
VEDRLRQGTSATGTPASDSDVVVLGSGNLGLVFLQEPKRLFLEDLDERYPRLVPGLARHPGVSFVAAMSRADGPVAVGAGGRHRLQDGSVEGEDPLAPFGRLAPGLLATATEMVQAPDLYVNSCYDEDTQEIAAFEELVGAHGGLGGWQEQGMLLAPVELAPSSLGLVGAEQLHEALVGMLEKVGHRRDLVGQGTA